MCREVVLSEGPWQTQVPKEAIDGFAPSVLDTFSGSLSTASYEFWPTSEDNPRRETGGFDSHHGSEAWCARKGTVQAERAETGVPKREYHRPKCTPRLLTGKHSRFLNIFREFRVYSRAFSPTKKKTRDEKPVFRFASCSRGLMFPRGYITGPKCRGLVCPDGDIAGPKFQHGERP